MGTLQGLARLQGPPFAGETIWRAPWISATGKLITELWCVQTMKRMQQLESKDASLHALVNNDLQDNIVK